MIIEVQGRAGPRATRAMALVGSMGQPNKAFRIDGTRSVRVGPAIDPSPSRRVADLCLSPARPVCALTQKQNVIAALSALPVPHPGFLSW